MHKDMIFTLTYLYFQMKVIKWALVKGLSTAVYKLDGPTFFSSLPHACQHCYPGHIE